MSTNTKNPFAEMISRRIIMSILAVSVLACALVGGFADAAQARPVPWWLTTSERVVNSAEAQKDWCVQGLGCVLHQSTKADLRIVYGYVPGKYGFSRTPIRAYVSGTTRTWTTFEFVGLQATTQVTLGPSYFQTRQYRYGVEGGWIGRSHRTDHWREPVPLATALADRAGLGFMKIDIRRG